MPVRPAGSRCLRCFQPSSQLPGPAWPCLALPGLDAHISFTKHYFYGVHIKRTHSVHGRRAGSASQPVPAGPGTSCLLLCALSSQLPVYVRGWVSETGNLFFPLVFFFSLFAGRIPPGHAVAAGRLPCVGLSEERWRVYPSLAGEVFAPRSMQAGWGRDVPRLRHRLASRFPHAQKK